MKTILTTLLIAVALGSSSCGSKKAEQKALVVYFSATGTTAAVAQLISEQTGADLCEIKPETPYSATDLDWRDKQSRSSVEMNDPASRPAVLPVEKGPAAYDVIYLGYPIWWDSAPHAVDTFIESHDLKGKRIIPFATSGSSRIDNSVKQLRASYPDIVWEEGELLNGATEQSVAEWLESSKQKHQPNK